MPRTLEDSYQTARCHTLKDRSINIYKGENFKSHSRTLRCGSFRNLLDVPTESPSLISVLRERSLCAHLWPFRKHMPHSGSCTVNNTLRDIYECLM